MALLREDCDVKLLDGVCVSLIYRPAHLALLCDWLLEFSRTLLAPDAAKSADVSIHNLSRFRVAAELAQQNPVVPLALSASLSYAESSGGGGEGGGYATAGPGALQRLAMGQEAVVAGLDRAKLQDASFRYFVDKVCKIQVCPSAAVRMLSKICKEAYKENSGRQNGVLVD
jgi:hypothetical protein